MHFSNIGYSATIIAFYVFPFLFFKKNSLFLLIKNFFYKKNNFFIIIIIFTYLLILFFFNNENEFGSAVAGINKFSEQGKGFYYKFILLITKNSVLRNILLYLGLFLSFIILK